MWYLGSRTRRTDSLPDCSLLWPRLGTPGRVTRYLQGRTRTRPRVFSKATTRPGLPDRRRSWQPLRHGNGRRTADQRQHPQPRIFQQIERQSNEEISSNGRIFYQRPLPRQAAKRSLAIQRAGRSYRRRFKRPNPQQGRESANACQGKDSDPIPAE